jgi:hypothetical protein
MWFSVYMFSLHRGNGIYVLSMSELRREETGIRHVRMRGVLDGVVVGLARWVSGTQRGLMNMMIDVNMVCRNKSEVKCIFDKCDVHLTISCV